MVADLFACIDLGTNTFHLLIGRFWNGKLEQVYRERHFVKVAEDGIHTIGQAPFDRAKKAAKSLGKSLQKYHCTQAVAFGTAALRTASNGLLLKQELEKLLGLDIELIDGKREAELISKGTALAGIDANDYLIMDIGGGSVEFIHVLNGQMKFSESYPIGAQVLKQKYHTQEPFYFSESNSIQEKLLFKDLEDILHQVVERITKQTILVGASGTFDVLGEIYGTALKTALKSVRSAEVENLYQQLVHLNIKERSAQEEIPADRADMIVVALALIVFFTQKMKQDKILVCDYALKEGAISEMVINGS